MSHSVRTKVFFSKGDNRVYSVSVVKVKSRGEGTVIYSLCPLSAVAGP